MNCGPAPFWYLASARVGDLLRVTIANGTVYIYSMQSVEVIPLQVLDMQQVVYPGLASDRERVTLISCGGTFVPYAGGGGEYESRVVLAAERIIP
jgi:sortase (surface protein transpeptidase)